MSLHLFVWEDVLVDYSSGIMFALAETADEARALVRKSEEVAWHGEKECSKEELEDFQCSVCRDLRTDPKIFDAPVGFAVWGGS